MKKVVFVFVMLLSGVLLFAACNTPVETPLNEDKVLHSIYTARKIWNTEATPKATIIKSHTELLQYFAENKDDYYLYSSTNGKDSLSYAVKKYDASFFEDNLLVLYAFDESSIALNHELIGYEAENSELAVSVRKVSDSDTVDFMISPRHLILEVPKSVGEIASAKFDFCN